MKWQEFEEIVKQVFDENGYETSFRVVFKDTEGKSEIDVVAEKYGRIIAIDAKNYSKGWHRASAIKNQAVKHLDRCIRYSRLKGRGVMPVIVSFIDDSIFFHSGCLIVPFEKLNDFILNIHRYSSEFIS